MKVYPICVQILTYLELYMSLFQGSCLYEHLVILGKRERAKGAGSLPLGPQSLTSSPKLFCNLMATAGRGHFLRDFLMNWLFHAQLFSCHETVE